MHLKHMELFLVIGIFLSIFGGTKCSSKIALVREMGVSKRSLELHPDLLTLEITPEDAESFSLALTRTRGLRPDDVKLVFDEPIAPELNNKKFKAKSLSNVGYYQDRSKKAVLAVINDGEIGDQKRKLYGTLILDGKTYEIKPVSKDVQKMNDILESRNLSPHQSHMVHTLEHVVLPNQNYNVDYKRRHEEKLERLRGEKGEYEFSFSQRDKFQHLIHDYTEGAKLRSSNRAKRQIDSEETVFHVGLTFLVEHSVFDYWMNELGNNAVEAVEHVKFIYTHLFHGIYLSYNNIDSNRITIRPWLQALRIATTRTASEAYAVYISNNRIELQATERRIRQSYMPQNDMDWKNTDHIMMWTKLSLSYGGSGGILGLAADICGICEPGNSITQNHEYGLFSYFTGAHELGHVLGALHDDNDFDVTACRATKKYLMTPYSIQLTQNTFENSFEFSECSVYMFEQCFRGQQYSSFPVGFEPSPRFPRVCVYDNICEHGEPVEDDLEEALPGARYSLTEQCQLGTGNEDAAFVQACQDYKTSLGICKQLYCVIGNSCTNNGNIEMRAVAGSPCATGKVCWKGECVNENSFEYTPDHGSTNCGNSASIPDGCENQYSTATCREVVLLRPWECFSNKKDKCSRLCMEWDLYDVNDPPCTNEIGTGSSPSNNNNAPVINYDTPPNPTTQSSWQYAPCGYHIIEGHMVKCPNGDKCIPMWWFGDWTADCNNGADEMKSYASKVPSGFLGYSRCPKKFRKLILTDWFCDGYKDCSGAGRDEISSNCNNVIEYCDAYYNGTVNCPNDPRICVEVDQLCDGVNDCGDGNEATDEDPYFCYLNHHTDTVQCEDGQIQCPGGLLGRPCIELWEACNGFNDCYSASGNSLDEDQDFCNRLPSVNCAYSEFHCPGRDFFCFPDDFLCDGFDDCGDGYDERNCGYGQKQEEPAGKDELVRNLNTITNKRLKDIKKKKVPTATLR